MQKKVLAIDFGTKRIGLAVSHASLAQPLKIILNDDQVLENIRQVVAQGKITQLVVGMSENEMAVKIQNFVEKLKEKISLPIALTDETLSSYQTHQKLATSHMKLKKRQGPIDHYAAAEFLQEWLDENNDAA